MKMMRSIAAIVSMAACSAWAQVTYQWTDITPPTGTVYGITTHVVDANRLVVNGYFPASPSNSSYQILYSTDAGRTWNAPASRLPFVVGLRLLAHVGLPGVLYLEEPSDLGGRLSSTHEGHLYRSDDFGRTWSLAHTTPVGQQIHPFGVDPLDAHGLYAFRDNERLVLNIGFSLETSNPGITRSHNDGVDWTAPLALPDGFDLQAPTPSAPTRLFMAENAGVLVSVDSGASWSRIDSTPSLPSMSVRPDPQHANVLYAHGGLDPNYRLLRSDDSGLTWRVIFSSATYRLDPVIDPIRTNVLWLPYVDVMLRSEDRGDTWQEVAYPRVSSPTGGSVSGYLVASAAEPGVVYVLLPGQHLFRGVPVSVADPIVVEYHYEADRYWLTPLAGEAVSQDYRQQPGNVFRTGLRWGAWRVDDAPAGAVGSCRFWPKPYIGRSRVIVQQGSDCEALKRDPGWILEAENEFFTMPPVNNACPANTVPVRRFLNLQPDFNHRWVADPSLFDQMRVTRGWYDEGVRFCARPLGPTE